MQEALGELLRKRKDRTLAVILGVKERECDPQLSPEAARRLRKAILDAINDYHELVVDVMGSFDRNGEVVLNEDYLAKIDELHHTLVRIPLRGTG